MPWVEYSEQNKITATLVDHGNPWDPGHTIGFLESVVYPDGGFARFNGWEIQLSEPCLVAFSTFADGTSKHPSMYFDEAGFSAGDLSQNWVVQNDFVSLDNGADPGTWGPIQGSTIETDLVVYTPPEWLGEGTPPFNWTAGYNLRLYIWEEEAELIANDDEATTNAGTPVTVDVLANDTLGDEPVALEQLEGPPTIIEQPANGTVSVAPDGKITYTPNPGFAGTDEFVYRIAVPGEEVCIKLLVVDAEGRIEVIGDAPSWFDPQAGFDLRWEHDGSSGQNHWAFDGSLFFPLSWPPLPETCETSFSARLSQILPDPDGGEAVMREVDACIDTWCMG